MLILTATNHYYFRGWGVGIKEFRVNGYRIRDSSLRMSEADFERERAQLFQKLGLRYDPELLNSDNGPSTLQVKTALKRRTTAPPGVGASLLQQPADVPAPAQRKASVLADVTKSQIPTPAVREQTPEARQRATSPSPISNSVHAAGEERQENSSCTPEANGRASSPNRKLSSQITIAEPSIVASASNGGTAHEPHQGTGKEGQKPSLLSVPKVIKSLKPPSSSVDPPAFASPLNKSVSASAIPGTKRPTEAQLVRKASVPEQESLVDEGDNTKRPLPTGIKPPSKPFDVGTPARSEHTPSQGSGKIPLRRDSVGSIQRPATQQQLSSEHSNGSLPVPQPKLVNTTNGHTPDQKKTKNPNNLRIGSESQTSNGHVPLGTDGINFGKNNGRFVLWGTYSSFVDVWVWSIARQLYPLWACCCWSEPRLHGIRESLPHWLFLVFQVW